MEYITCYRGLFTNKQRAEEGSTTEKHQKPWVVIGHVVRNNDGRIILKKQNPGSEHFERSSKGTSIGTAFQTFTNGLKVSNHVAKQTDGSISCSTCPMYLTGDI